MSSPVLKVKSRFTDFETIVEECVRRKGSWGLLENDILFAVTFWLMTECGFVVAAKSGENAKKIDKVMTLPDNWKHGTKELYEAQFILPPYEEHLVRLVALPADDILCINIFVANVSPRNVHLKSLAIHSSGFVPRPKANQISSKFSNLDYVRLYIKTALIWPIRCSILTDEGIINGSLSGLSDEIKLKIFHFLEVEDVLALSETCHDLNRVCNDQVRDRTAEGVLAPACPHSLASCQGLWKTMFHRHFKQGCRCAGKEEECDDSTPWKDNFKQLYGQKPKTRGSEHSSLDSFHTAPEIPLEEIDPVYD